jgi:hypothetical protein
MKRSVGLSWFSPLRFPALVSAPKRNGRRVRALYLCLICAFHSPALPRAGFAADESRVNPSLFYWKSIAAVFPPNSMLVTLLLSTSTSEAAAFDGN